MCHWCSEQGGGMCVTGAVSREGGCVSLVQ